MSANGGWTLIEPCCGAAALTLHLLGAPRGLVPYQGSKWTLRRPLEQAVRDLGFEGPPSHVILGDVSQWGQVVATTLTRTREVLEALEPLVELGNQHQRLVYQALRRRPVPQDPVLLAAATLWLQRVSYGSRAIGEVDGQWKLHGSNPTGVTGAEKRNGFGAVGPVGPMLLKSVRCLLDARQVPVEGRRGLIPPNFNFSGQRVLVYIDPPYAGSSGYSCGTLSRAEVIGYARSWAARGAVVIVSEGEPLRIEGWGHRQIRAPSRVVKLQRFRRATTGSEWITTSRRDVEEAASTARSAVWSA